MNYLVVRYGVQEGYYSINGDSETRTGQRQCGDPAFFCTGGRRFVVSVGHYSINGAEFNKTAEALCPAGHYCQGGRLIPCPEGYFGTLQGATQLTQCNACPAGKYNPHPGSTSNSSCASCNYELG